MRNPRQRFGVWSALTALAALLMGCGGGSNTGTTNLSDDMTGTITVAYSTTYVFDSDDTSVIWWDKVKKEFEAAYPKAKLTLQGFNGTDVDLKLKQRVKGIDAILGGHTHDALPRAIMMMDDSIVAEREEHSADRRDQQVEIAARQVGPPD